MKFFTKHLQQGKLIDNFDGLFGNALLPMKKTSQLATLALLAAGLRVASAADITGTITLNGTPPPEIVNTDISADANCGKLHSGPVMTTFFVVGSNKGLKDVVVYLADVKGKSTGGSAAPFILDQRGCEYAPYVFAVQTGQKIIVKNSDPVTHNVHVTPAAVGNDEQNMLQPAGDPDQTLVFASAEDFITFKCDVHAWMRSYVTVVDNPWFAVTDADGKFKIANVPPGKYTVQAMHRKASGGKPVTKDLEVKDASATLDFVLDAPQ